GDVQLRRDGLAGLADLELARVVTRVDGRTRRADRTLEGVGEGLDDLLEVLRGADATTTRDDDGRLGELGTVATDDRVARDDLGGVLGLGNLHLDDLSGAGGRGRLDGARTQRVDRSLAGDGRLDGEGATEDRVDGRAVGLDLDDVAEGAGPGAGRETTRDLLALERGGQDDRGGALLGEAGQDVDLGGDEVVLDRVALGDVDLLRTGLLEGLGERGGGAGLTEDDRGGLSECTSGGQQLEG